MKYSHDDVIKMLASIPKAKAEMESPRVAVAIAVINRRLELGLTQETVTDAVRAVDAHLPDDIVSRIECAEDDVELPTYYRVLDVLNRLN